VGVLSESLFFHHTDHLGMPIAMTDGTEEFAWREEGILRGRRTDRDRDVTVTVGSSAFRPEIALYCAAFLACCVDC
jgi:hypothetical protein